MSIENYFFLVASVVALSFSAGHAVWGQRNIMPDVLASDMLTFTKHMLFVIWNQPTVFHLLSACALLVASGSSDDTSSKPLAVFIALVSFGFFLNYVATSLAKNRAALAQIIPQTIALAIYLSILFAGIRA